MKKNSFFIIFLLLISFFICTKFIDKKNELESNMISQTNADITKTPQGHKDFTSSKIILYKVSRDVFCTFLDQPSSEIFKKQNIHTKHITLGTECFYTTSNFTRFKITKEISDFLCDKDNLQSYLLKNGYNGNIDDVAIFDTPNTPITVWVKMNSENIFFTINETHNTIESRLIIYSYVEYKQKFGGKDGVLTINDNVIETRIAPVVYQNYADVPMVIILEELGAQINYINKEYLLITLDNKSFVLNKKEKELRKITDWKNNIFHMNDGVVVFVYTLDDEFMVDSMTLSCVFREMGIDVTFKVDYLKNVVQIVSDKR